MMGFSSSEILNSIIYAAVFGVLFSALFSFMTLIFGVVRGLPYVIREICIFKKIFPLPSFKAYVDMKKISLGQRILSVFLFTLGFILISFLALDGVIRVYMLIVVFASFYLSNSIFFSFLLKILLWILNRFLQLFTIIVRIAFYPIFYLFHKKKCISD